MNKLRSFISDSDGFSAKDFLMVVFVLAFIVEQIVVFALSLKSSVNPDTLSIISTLDGIIMTIIGGVFSVQAVKEFRSPRSEDVSYEYSQETPMDMNTYTDQYTDQTK